MRNRPAAETGRLAETATVELLKSQGYEISAVNYLIARIGELDIIARKNDCLFFVEVKSRMPSADRFGGLPATITPAKLIKMRKTAWCYIKEHRLMNCDASFLAALVNLEKDGKIGDISLLPIEWL